MVSHFAPSWQGDKAWRDANSTQAFFNMGLRKLARRVFFSSLSFGD
jgi:hypothetical protein